MIVVDSSVWIGQFRGAETRSVRLLNEVIDENDVIVGDVVLLEVLQGARDDAHALQLEQRLRKFTFDAMVDGVVAVAAARNYRSLRSKGITIRKTIDLIIATFCVERGHVLLHDDRDFSSFVTHFGLRVI